MVEDSGVGPWATHEDTAEWKEQRSIRKTVQNKKTRKGCLNRPQKLIPALAGKQSSEVEAE